MGEIGLLNENFALEDCLISLSLSSSISLEYA